MARIRSLKPEFWTDGVMVQLDPFARLLYMGMWNFSLCDHGHLPDDATRLKLQVLPADDVDVSELLEALIVAGRVERLHLPDGRAYLHIPRFSDHQKLDKRWSPRCYVCAAQNPSEGSEDSSNPPEPRGNSPKLSDTQPLSPQDRTGQDSKGQEPPIVPLDSKADEPKSKTPGRKRPATPLPDDWQPNQTHVAKARELGVDGRHEEEKFRAHAAANDRRQVDWNQAFTQWLLNARPSSNGNRASTDDDTLPLMWRGIQQ